MNCPSCHTGVLAPSRLEERLPCYMCSACAGAFLSLSPYVDWVESEPQRSPATPAFEPAAPDSKQALLCPKCSRIMVKFKVLADAVHHLDFCFGCEEVWLDPGEWSYLKRHGLDTSITAVSTDAWQRRIREEFGSTIRVDRFRLTIGEPAFAEAQRFRQWLETQPQRAEILRYLSAVE